MVERKQYLEKLKKLKDKQIIKVVTGVRRCGKSTLLVQFREYLKACGVAPEQIISINFEDVIYGDMLDYKLLYEYISNKLVNGKMTYIFLDEVQNVSEFQKAVDSLFIKENVDIYLTGSNAQMLSGELATLLSGRYIEVKMLPFSFAEYFALVGGDKKAAWQKYFQRGGFPYLAKLDDESVDMDYLSGIYSTVLLKDIVARKKVQDVFLLESVIKFLFDNIGNIVSTKKIADTLTSFGRKTTSQTVENYLTALMEAFVLYRAGRYDVKGKQHLRSLEKYYVVDVGLRRLLLKDNYKDVGYILENIVYLELIRRGYNVSIGKVDDLEIDFIAEKYGDRFYFQVAATVLDSTTFEREVASLKKVSDNYPKYIISMDEYPMGLNGINQINVIDFLLGDII
ncbi:MAG: ATP-binding protein [Phascolarctobacterium sp.]|nr:ATP-binding protein [Phascolarctobacterium sp.]